jgi:hypothetical protein
VIDSAYHEGFEFSEWARRDRFAVPPAVLCPNTEDGRLIQGTDAFCCAAACSCMNLRATQIDPGYPGRMLLRAGSFVTFKRPPGWSLISLARTRQRGRDKTRIPS